MFVAAFRSNVGACSLNVLDSNLLLIQKKAKVGCTEAAKFERNVDKKARQVLVAPAQRSTFVRLLQLKWSV
jgi:hypothetical protein